MMLQHKRGEIEKRTENGERRGHCSHKNPFPAPKMLYANNRVPLAFVVLLSLHTSEGSRGRYEANII
jgi:hypothetical protein